MIGAELKQVVPPRPTPHKEIPVTGWMIGTACAALMTLILMLGAAAPAAEAAPAWKLNVTSPTRVEPGGELTMRVNARNVGDATADGSGALDIALPSGVTGVAVEGAFGWQGAPSGSAPFTWSCSDAAGASVMHCDLLMGLFGMDVPPGQATFEDVILRAAVAPGAAGPLAAEVEMAGGGADGVARVVDQLHVSPTPDFGIEAFDGGAFEADGSASTQAGAHPVEAAATFKLKTILDRGMPEGDGGALRDARVDLPAGLAGNPMAMPQCSKTLKMASNKQAFLDGFDANRFCPLDTIVGIADITIVVGEIPGRLVAPVYNLQPPPGVAAQFGFNVQDVVTTLDAQVRSDGDYGVTVTARDASQAKTVLASTVTLWGQPADPSHDDQRCLAFFNVSEGGNLFPEGTPLPTCDPGQAVDRPWNAPSSANRPPIAFLTNPTACTPAGVGLETRLHVESWDPSRASDDASFVSHLSPGYPLPLEEWGDPQGPTGCADLPFDPSVSVDPDTSAPDAPSGLSFDMSFPSDGLLNPSGLSQAHLKRASVTLPEGMSISPSAADGLAACSDEQSAVGTLEAAACPAGAKVGTVEATTPLLDEVLTGGLYIGSQRSMDPASGEMFRLLLTLNSEERGIHVKLPGQVRIDPDTGRIETTFDNNPQVPVGRLSLRLKSGPRAPLAMPADCGSKSIDVLLESWGGQTVTRSDSFNVDCPGQAAFAPEFEAGSISPTGGAFSPFVAQIVRPDRQQFLSGVQVDMPKGLVANLNGVALCGDFLAANGGCPESSRIGTVTVGAGPGSSPFYLRGPVYLTEGYKGAPYGLSVQVPVKAGPFDLGTVIVRQAIHVDPETAELSVISDPLPQIVKGVPVRLRSASVDVDRPNFTINPTSCAVKQVRAALTSIQGATHQVARRFQASDCASLAFRPRLAMRLTGKRQRRTGGHPGLKVGLTQQGGQANLDQLRVELPKTLALDPANANGLCSFEEGSKPDPKCPASSVIGSATARTPVLSRPLTGRVYFVENKRRTRQGNLVRTLPTLLIALRGEVSINIRQRSSVKQGRLVSTATNIPDAPVSRFDLTLKGGRGGILTVTRNARRRFNLCRADQVADVFSDAQNRRRADFSVTMQTPCAKTLKRSRNRR